MAAIKVAPPRFSGEYGPGHDRFLEEIWRRTGGDADQVNSANVTAVNAATQATGAQAAADLAKATADTAVTNAATAQAAANAAQADANEVSIQLIIDDLDANGITTAAGRLNVVSPHNGTITKILIVPNGTVTNETDVTVYINTVAITNGTVTIPASTGVGTVISQTPTGLNTIAKEDAIAALSDGAAGTSVKATVLLMVTRS